jgi:hypothetical protein
LSVGEPHHARPVTTAHPTAMTTGSDGKAAPLVIVGGAYLINDTVVTEELHRSMVKKLTDKRYGRGNRPDMDRAILLMHDLPRSMYYHGFGLGDKYAAYIDQTASAMPDIYTAFDEILLPVVRHWVLETASFQAAASAMTGSVWCRCRAIPSAFVHTPWSGHGLPGQGEAPPSAPQWQLSRWIKPPGRRPLLCQVRARRSLVVPYEVRCATRASRGLLWSGSLLYFSAVPLVSRHAV